MSEKSNEVSVVEENALSSDTENNVITHNLYDYFKEHPSLFITFTSGAVAVISVALKLIAFLGDNSYLSYFNVNMNIYKQSIGFIYFFAIALAFFVVVMVFQSFISKTFENYLPYKRIFLLYKYSLKKIKNEKNKLRKENKQFKYNLFKLINDKFEKKESKRIKKDLSKKFKNLENNCSEIKREIQKYRLFLCLIIGMSCIFAWIVLVVIYSIMLSFATFDWNVTLKSVVTSSTVYVLIYSLGSWLSICVIGINRKEIKRYTQSDKISEFAQKYHCSEAFPIREIFDGNMRSVFNDSNLRRLVSAIIISLVVLIFLSAYAGTKSAANQKDFFVVNVENQTYVMIYNNGENMIIEKAEITDNGIVIDTNHQRMISSQNIDMKKYVFEKVDVIRTEHSFSNESTNNIETTKNIGGK